MKRWTWFVPLIALLAAWWFAARWQAAMDLRVTPDPDCDVASESCTLALPGGGQVQLTLSPRPPILMKPVTVEVALKGGGERVWLDLVGTNMDMGPNREELLQEDPGLWKGQVIFPICSSSEMHWEARVMVERDGRTIAAPFPFTTRP